MKILGISLGTKNGSNDAMCKEALIAAQEAGAKWHLSICMTGTFNTVPDA